MKKYDWVAIREFYEAGHTVRECQQKFGFSNGAWQHALERGEVLTSAPPRPRGQTRQAVARLAEEGKSLTEIAVALGVSKPTVCFHKRKLGILPQPGPAERYDWREIRVHYEAGFSMRDCQRTFGFSGGAWSDAVARGAIRPRPRAVPLEEVLAAGRRRSRHHVKTRLLLAGVKDTRCEHCDLTEWRGQPLSLELHHINGDGLDNRLENLLLLCPNCHSQTDTWGGKNKARKAA